MIHGLGTYVFLVVMDRICIIGYAYTPPRSIDLSSDQQPQPSEQVAKLVRATVLLF